MRTFKSEIGFLFNFSSRDNDKNIINTVERIEPILKKNKYQIKTPYSLIDICAAHKKTKSKQ